MPPTVFWSWQSDKPGRISRHFLKSVLSKAVAGAGEDLGLEESERPGLDHDTKGEPGLVSIPESILAKIDKSTVFIADLTPVARSDAGRFVANPNVLIELGYAKKALGPRQIILVWNAAWGGCTPEDLPFDLRHRRMPFTFTLGEASSSDEIKNAEASLLPPLRSAIVECLRAAPAAIQPAAQEIHGIEHRAGDPSVWFEKGQIITVNAGTSFGADRVTVDESPRSFIRIIPSVWPTGVRSQGIRDGHHVEIHPLGDALGLTYGSTKGGIISYRSAARDEGTVKTESASQWFAKTGELWGFDGRVVFDDDRGNPTLATNYVVECWARFLLRAEAFFAHYKAQGPFEVRVGLTQLEGLHWPTNIYRDEILGLEDGAEVILRVPDLLEASRMQVLQQAHTAMREAFGMPSSHSELEQILKAATRR